MSSHSQDASKHLTVAQRGMLRTSVKCAPNATGREHVRNSQHFSPGKRTPQDPKAIRAAQRLACNERARLARGQTCGVVLTPEHGSLTQLAESMDLLAWIKRHNDPDDEYHLDLHQVVCIGSQFGDGVTFMEMTTLHFILNMARAIACEWPLQVQADGSFDFCDRTLGVIVFGVNSLRGKFRPVSWSLVPNESSEAFTFIYNGIRSAFFRLLKPGALSRCGHGCEVCNMIKDLQTSPEVAKVLSDPEEKLPVKKAGNDNTTKWSKFVYAVLTEAKLLICYAHASGDTMHVKTSCPALILVLFLQEFRGKSNLFESSSAIMTSTRLSMKWCRVPLHVRRRESHVLCRQPWFSN